MNTVFVRYGGRGASTLYDKRLYLSVDVMDEQGNPSPMPQQMWWVTLFPDDTDKTVERRIREQMAIDYETDEQHVIVLG